MPRTGWGHSGHAPPLDLAWQTPTEVSEPGLPPWEILDGWVLRCPGERRGLPGAATLGGDVAPDGSGVTPLGSGRNSLLQGISQQCAVLEGQSVCPSCPCTLPVHRFVPDELRVPPQCWDGCFTAARTWDSRSLKSARGARLRWIQCKAQKPRDKHPAMDKMMNCCPSRWHAPPESCQSRGGKGGDREDGSLPPRAQALLNWCWTRSVAGKIE